jgi:hypothetical protein
VLYLRKTAGGETRGTMLVMSMLFFSVVLVGVMTTMSFVRTHTKDMRTNRNDLVARKAAEGAVHEGIAFVKNARDLAALGVPFAGIDNLDPNATSGAGGYSTILANRKFFDDSGSVVAEYDVLMDISSVDSGSRGVGLLAYAYVPSKAEYQSGAQDAIRSDAHVSIEVALEDSEVFDYAYFINHWGWFFGDTIVANGNVRSNGQFDFGGYSATVNGSPRYESASGHDLVNYIDDNNDGVTDGSDGGAFSGFQVVNAGSVQGMGAQTENQHNDAGYVQMPNLTDLGLYESKATTDGGSISVGGSTYVSGVLGDDVGENQNLYLVGTPSNPIVIDGPVVVRGSVIISGTVTGQGTIYAGDNVYVPDDLNYSDPPATERPASNDEATTEAWRTANADKDALGLFAREHVVIGDYTNSTWQTYVSSWVIHSLNESSEDAGIDGVQNTADGADGVAGTADDDVLEGDGTWTVSTYTTQDAALGLIPAGKSIGDVIPGSGEDIDGDGAQDGTTAMSEFNIPATLGSADWAGNISGTPNFSDVSSIYISKIDANFYTNHTFAALMLAWGDEIDINGSIVSRNESIIYGADGINMNHDARMLAGGAGAYGLYLPQSWKPIEILQWDFDRDIGVNDDDMLNPTDIVGYWVGTYTP